MGEHDARAATRSPTLSPTSPPKTTSRRVLRDQALGGCVGDAVDAERARRSAPGFPRRASRRRTHCADRGEGACRLGGAPHRGRSFVSALVLFRTTPLSRDAELRTRALAGNVELGAERHEATPFALDNRRELARFLRGCAPPRRRIPASARSPTKNHSTRPPQERRGVLDVDEGAVTMARGVRAAGTRAKLREG